MVVHMCNLAVQKPNQEDYEYEASLNYINPISKTKQNKKQNQEQNPQSECEGCKSLKRNFILNVVLNIYTSEEKVSNRWAKLSL